MAIPVGHLIDRLVPWCAAVVSISLYIVVTAIGVAADGLNIASVVIVCIGVDVLRQTIQMTMTTWVFGTIGRSVYHQLPTPTPSLAIKHVRSSFPSP